MLLGRQLARYMSNSKWVKLLEALSAVEGLVKVAKVKLVWDNEFRDINNDETVKYNFDIYDHTMNSMIQGYPTGFYEFIEIEWLEFPAESQDISFIERIISSTGNYKIEVTDKYLRLYCYKEGQASPCFDICRALVSKPKEQ